MSEQSKEQTVRIKSVNPTDTEVVDLLTAHIAHGNAHYPDESNHHMTPGEHTDEGVALFAAWLRGACVGLAGLKRLDETSGELKSMHVEESVRGQGVGAKLVTRILVEARQAGLTQIWLETGSREASASARRLYERFGFVNCPPFGAYQEDPESVFMTRLL